MCEKLTNVGDQDSAAALNMIMTDEIGHLAIGKRGFDYVCRLDRLDLVSSWHRVVTQYFHDDLNPPFYIAASRTANFLLLFTGHLPNAMIQLRRTASADCQHATPNLRQ